MEISEQSIKSEGPNMWARTVSNSKGFRRGNCLHGNVSLQGSANKMSLVTWNPLSSHNSHRESREWNGDSISWNPLGSNLEIEKGWHIVDVGTLVTKECYNHMMIVLWPWTEECAVTMDRGVCCDRGQRSVLWPWIEEYAMTMDRGVCCDHGQRSMLWPWTEECAVTMDRRVCCDHG